MVSVYGKDRDGYVDIRVLVVDVIESSGSFLILSRTLPGRVVSIPFKGFSLVTQHLQLAWFLSQTIHPQRSHDVVHGLPGWFC